MKKYNAEQIRNERIAFKDLTPEQSTKLLNHFKEKYPNDYNMRISDIYNCLRLYNAVDNNAGQSNNDYIDVRFNDYRATQSITFDQFDFEEEVFKKLYTIEECDPVYEEKQISYNYQGLFNLMSEEHNLLLTISEMDEIIKECKKVINK